MTSLDQIQINHSPDETVFNWIRVNWTKCTKWKLCKLMAAYDKIYKGNKTIVAANYNFLWILKMLKNEWNARMQDKWQIVSLILK